MLLPAPLPDEIFCSLLARMGRMNGYADLRDMALTYCAGTAISSFIDAEIDLSRFSCKTDYAYPDAEELLQRFTWYGAQVRLGEVAWHQIDGQAKENARLRLGASMFPSSAVLGFCPSCREHDLHHFGMTYWHRLHQLPIVFFCPVHGDRVVRIPIKRSILHKEFPVPGDFESVQHTVEPISGVNEKFWRGVAVMAAEALQGDELPDAEMTFSVLAEGLRRKKFSVPLSGRRLSIFAEDLAAQAFEDSIDTNSPDSVAFVKSIARSLDQPAAGVVLGRVVLLYWLFGGWGAVQERCRWLSVFGSESRVTVRKSVTEVSKLEALHRRVCAAYIKEYPECTRLDFLRAEYRSFRWLLHNDKIWLDRQLPIPVRAGKQLVLF